jgi:hypothetical protein
MVAELTLSETILLAAAKLEEQGNSPFSAEDLTVAAWKMSPRAFGLKGYWEQHPDSNRVLASIMGERGLARKGWLVKIGQKMYSLSKEGQRICRRLSDGEEGSFPAPEDDEPTPHLSREQDKLIIALLDSTARDKIKHNKTHDLSFADACRFWGLTENLSPEAIDSRLQFVERTLSLAERTAAKHTLRVGHRDVSRADVELLRDTSDNLQERFARHLSLLRSRSGR